MSKLSNLPSNKPIKGLFVGDPGTGKTGGLTSLVSAGYKLRIYDFDNLLAPLFHYVRHECPDKIDNVLYQTFTDKMKAKDNPALMIGARMSVQPFTDGIPTAFVNGLKQLSHWKTPDEDLGDPGTWGLDTVVVIDSLSMLASSAMLYVQSLNPLAKEPQTHYFSAQQMVLQILSLLKSDQFNTNVLVLAHIDYDKDHLGTLKGFPRSIGSAINSQIGAHFNCIFKAESEGSSKVIRTNSTGVVDLKNPVAFNVPDKLPLKTGLATIFEAVRGGTNA